MITINKFIKGRVGVIFFLIIFCFFPLWFILIPNLENLIHIPQLNSRIQQFFETPENYEVKLTKIYFDDPKKLRENLPLNVDSLHYAYILEKLMENKQKNGFAGRIEPKTLFFTLYTNDAFFLTCICVWDERKSIMEIEFLDEFGHRINQYFKVEKERAMQLFSLIYEV